MDPNKKESHFIPKIDLHIRGPQTCESADASAINQVAAGSKSYSVGHPKWIAYTETTTTATCYKSQTSLCRRGEPDNMGAGGGGTRENMYYVARAVFLVIILTI